MQLSQACFPEELPHLIHLLCPRVAVLLQDRPSDLCIVDVHLAAIGLQVHCNKGGDGGDTDVRRESISHLQALSMIPSTGRKQQSHKRRAAQKVLSLPVYTD